MPCDCKSRRVGSGQDKSDFLHHPERKLWQKELSSRRLVSGFAYYRQANQRFFFRTTRARGSLRNMGSTYMM
jgi:hypothetical protein